MEDLYYNRLTNQQQFHEYPNMLRYYNPNQPGQYTQQNKPVLIQPIQPMQHLQQLQLLQPNYRLQFPQPIYVTHNQSLDPYPNFNIHNKSVATLPPLSSLVSHIDLASSSSPEITKLNPNPINNNKIMVNSPSSQSFKNRNCISYILTSPPNSKSNKDSSHNHFGGTLNPNVLVRQTTPPLYNPSNTSSPLEQQNQPVENLKIANMTTILPTSEITTTKHTNVIKQTKQCPVCGKVCSRPSTLKTHFLIHTGDNPFKCTCEGCTKSFNVKSNMLRHLKSHQRKKEKLAKKQAAADSSNKQKIKNLKSKKFVKKN